MHRCRIAARIRVAAAMRPSVIVAQLLPTGDAGRSLFCPNTNKRLKKILKNSATTITGSDTNVV